MVGGIDECEKESEVDVEALAEQTEAGWKRVTSKAKKSVFGGFTCPPGLRSCGRARGRECAGWKCNSFGALK